MKLLSFAIPCYNSKDYMEHCIESILPGGDDVEIIIVDDGSKDETAAIADRYAAEYPDIVKAVHQENGGHGEAVNTGLKNATGSLSRRIHRLICFLPTMSTRKKEQGVKRLCVRPAFHAMRYLPGVI